MLRNLIFSSLSFFSTAALAVEDVNGCPNANLSGAWSASVDWTCSGSLPDTVGWYFNIDGTGFSDHGQNLTWHCESEKVFVNVPGEQSLFSGIYGDGSSLSGRVQSGARNGCWVASHIFTLRTDYPDSGYRGPRIPGGGQLPPAVYSPPGSSYASPSW